MANYKVPALDEFEWQPPVKDKDSANPPVSPSKGDRYIVGTEGSGSGIDEYTKLMLHCNGINDSTTFTDEIGKTISRSGALIKTAQYKFGEASGYFAGDGYLYTSDSDDWDFGTGDFCIDFWVRFNTVQTCVLVGRGGWGNNGQQAGWSIFFVSNNLYFRYYIDGSTNTISKNESWTPSADTWYHIAVTRNSGDLRFFINGTILGSSTSATANMTLGTCDFHIGTNPGKAGDFLNGYIDELRVSKGAYRWNSNFSVPTDEYSMPAGDWADETDNIAMYNGSSWDFITATEGMQTWVEDENKYYKFDGSDWSLLSNFDSPVFTGESTIPTIDLTDGQIKFPATQNASSDANTLDDYEEGTFTPGISFGNGTTGITYSSQTGYYTKIGNVVLFWIRVVLSNKGSSSGYARVTGLPFTASDPLYGGMSIGFSYNVTFANQMILNLPSNSTTATFYEITESGGSTNLTEGDFSNNSNLILSGVYKTS